VTRSHRRRTAAPDDTAAVFNAADPMVDHAGPRVVLLAAVEEIAITDMQIAAGSWAAPHRHDNHLESFYVFAGELALRSAGTRCRQVPARGCRCPQASRTPWRPPAQRRCAC
jgi:uncharacterized cupin superfamily protein